MVAVVGLACISLTTAWTVPTVLASPTRVSAFVVQAPDTPDGALARDLVDPSVFAVALWNPVPGPEPADAEQVADHSLPFEYELIGITSEGEIWHAVLYDPRTDELVVVRSGDSLGSHEVADVTATEVVFVRDTRCQTLSLDPRRGRS